MPGPLAPSLIVFLALLLPGEAPPPASAPGPTTMGSPGEPATPADSLVDAWIDVLGGLERYRTLRSARFTLTTELYDPESGRLKRTRPRYVVIAKDPDGEKARIERWEGDDFIQQGFDGREAWATRNGERLPDTARDLREVRYVSGDVNYWIALPYKLRDPGVIFHYEGRDAEGRHDVKVTFREGVGEHQDTWHYYFVEGRIWPVEVTYQEAGSRRVNRTRWEDLREANGYVYVGRRVHLDGRGRIWKVIRTHDVEINPILPEGIFSEPAG